MKIKTLGATGIAVLLALIQSASVMAHGDEATSQTVTPAYRYPIANVPGKTVAAVLVDYKPGGKSAPHRHGASFVVAYVLSGAVRSKVDRGDERIYRAGESWTENPGAHHWVSENASDTEPARLLAVFIADTREKKLTTFDKQ